MTAQEMIKRFGDFGKDAPKKVKVSDALVLGGLDWEVEERDIGSISKRKVDDIPVVQTVCDFKKAIVRKDNHHIVGVVGNSYKPISNAEQFKFVDEIIGEGRATVKGAGMLEGGQRIFLTMKLPKDLVINKKNDDIIEQRFNLFSSHNGGTAITFRYDPFRLLCSNGLVGLDTSMQKIVKIRHTKNYKEAMNAEEIRDAFDMTQRYYEWFGHQCDKLFHDAFTADQMRYFIEKLLPGRKDRKSGEIVVSTRTANVRSEIRRLFRESDNLKHCRNTRWAAYNAVTEYVDHNQTVVKRERSEEEAHFVMTSLGRGMHMKENAFEILTAGIKN
jgi:phage/plasmid-like protein (TIGR03299 family)